MDIRKFNREQIKKLINSPDFLIIYESLDEPSKKILRPYIKDKKLPSMAKRIKSATKDTVEWIKKGSKFVSNEEFDRRMKICYECEFWNKTHCRVCGCFKAKQKMTSSKCPLPNPKW
jgi:hypothetical protein